MATPCRLAGTGEDHTDPGLQLDSDVFEPASVPAATRAANRAPASANATAPSLTRARLGQFRGDRAPIGAAGLVDRRAHESIVNSVIAPAGVIGGERPPND